MSVSLESAHTPFENPKLNFLGGAFVVNVLIYMYFLTLIYLQQYAKRYAVKYKSVA